MKYVRTLDMNMNSKMKMAIKLLTLSTMWMVIHYFKTNALMPFGGHLSIRKPIGTKAVFIFGQDECIFKQYSFSKKSWTLPDGTKTLIPKDEGQGVMLSSFMSREFGYGFELSGD
jgi:hypothetical protein